MLSGALNTSRFHRFKVSSTSFNVLKRKQLFSFAFLNIILAEHLVLCTTAADLLNIVARCIRF